MCQAISYGPFGITVKGQPLWIYKTCVTLQLISILAIRLSVGISKPAGEGVGRKLQNRKLRALVINADT